MDVTVLNPYELGLQMGCEFAEKAMDEDPESFWDDPQGVAYDDLFYDVLVGTREYYMLEMQDYSEEDRDYFLEGFREGVDNFIEDKC